MEFLQIKINRALFFVILNLLILSPYSSICQTNNLNLEQYHNLNWEEFVKKIEANYKVRLFYINTEIPDISIKVSSSQKDIMDLIQDNLSPYNLFLSKDEAGNIFISNKRKLITSLPKNFLQNKTSKDSTITVKQNKEKISNPVQDNYIETSKEYIARTIYVGSKNKGINKSRVKLSGYAKNAQTGIPLSNVTIIDKNTKKGVLTNPDGYFEFNLQKGHHLLTISSVNTKEKQLKLHIYSDGEIEIWLEEKIITLDDLEVRAKKTNRIKGTDMGIENLSTKAVKNIPLVFGEKDIIKVALLLPGVQTVGEGAAGFNVRGSPTDQNIFYINDLPIYNTSHASGFFSAFNSDAIDEFTLHKSNIPINYGGRLSSIFNINSKKGDKKRTTASGGLGFITGRVLAEGPIVKDKSSFLVGFRSTYSDWAIDLMTNNDKIKDSKANFFDAITNLSFQLDSKNLLNVFTYYSKDKMDFASTNNKMNYENAGASLIWNHYFKNASFKLSLVHSSYKFQEENVGNNNSTYHNNNQLQHSEIKANLNIKHSKKHTFTMGLNSIFYNNNMGSFIPLDENSSLNSIDYGTEKGLETAIYIGDNWEYSDKLLFNGGIRFNLFSYLGPQQLNIYKEGLPIIKENLTETVNYDNAFIKNYAGLDFRLSARYLLNDKLSLKLSFNRLHQYIYVLSNTIAISPNYKWKLIDPNKKPLSGDQISLGIFSSLFNDKFEFSLESYYKKNKNIIEIKDGADIFSSKDIEQLTLQGDLDAYGLEVMFKKSQGRFNGWINYTYSHSTVLVDSEFPENRINLGKSYKSNYDKPHNLNIVANYAFSRRFSMSTNFVYSTGRPITYPSANYYYNGGFRLHYSGRNAYRLPDYYRLDVSFTLEGNLKKQKIAHGSWTFSIYNVLGRNNAYSVYFRKDEDRLKGYKLSIFAAPIFSLTYNFKLGNYDN